MFDTIIRNHQQSQDDHIQSELKKVSLGNVEQSLVESLLAIQGFAVYHLKNDYTLLQEIIDHTVILHCAMVQYSEKEFTSLGMKARLNCNVLTVKEID